MSKRNTTIALVAFLLLQPALKGVAQVSLMALNVPSGQDFNTLASSGTSSVMPVGWVFLESGTNADALYTAGSGTGNAGNTFSFGTVINHDRALGGQRSGALIPLFGASFINNTGQIITGLQITYAGEQWRLGAAGRLDRLDFQYSLDASSLNSGTWIDNDSLDFIAPRTTLPTGAVNGNDPANRATLSHTINGLTVLPGATFWFRWTDFDATGLDDGLAIDDFFLIPISENPEISFTVASDTVDEGNTYVVLLKLSKPAFQVDSLHIDIGPTDAIYGIDYTTLPFTNTSIALPVNIGDSSLIFSVSTVDDIVDEPIEHITFTLSPGNSLETGGQNTFTLGILDNDLPTIQFEVASDSLVEGETRTLRLVLSSVLDTDVSVTLKVRQDHGLHYGHHQDYTTFPAPSPTGKITLTIPAGTTEATLEFQANKDQSEEDDETATFTIVSVSAGNIGKLASLAVTIHDLEHCRPAFVLHPNPTPGPVNIWTVPANRDKVMEGSLVDPDGNVLVATWGTVHELGEAFREALRGARRGTYIVRLTLCNQRVSLRLCKM